MTTSYYRGSQGILLVYDITDKKSFLAIRSWVAQIRQVYYKILNVHMIFLLKIGISSVFVFYSSFYQHSDENVNMILVGNKCDKLDERVYLIFDRIKFAEIIIIIVVVLFLLLLLLLLLLIIISIIIILERNVQGRRGFG